MSNPKQLTFPWNKDNKSSFDNFYTTPINKQLLSLIKENNALEYSVEHCIKWFYNVEKRWKEKNYETGRLVVCDDHCGSCKKT